MSMCDHLNLEEFEKSINGVKTQMHTNFQTLKEIELKQSNLSHWRNMMKLKCEGNLEQFDTELENVFKESARGGNHSARACLPDLGEELVKTTPRGEAFTKQRAQPSVGSNSYRKRQE